MPQTRNQELTGQSAFNAYMSKSRRIPMLTASQEVELAKLAKIRGPAGKQARDQLIQANLRYVASIARKQVRPGISLEDLVQEGNLGLLRAADAFDETRGFRFITYARWWVQQFIRAYLEDNGHAVKLPARSAQQISKMNRALALLARRGEPPTEQAIAEIMAVTVEQVRAIADYAKQPISINDPFADGEGELGDHIEDTTAVNPEDAAVESDRQSKVLQSLAKLNDKQRQVIILRFGLDGEGERTLEEISHIWGITRERVRQIEAKALELLKTGDSGRVLKTLR